MSPRKKLVVYISTDGQLPQSLKDNSEFVIINSQISGWSKTINRAGGAVAQDIIQTISYGGEQIFELNIISKGIGGIISLSALSAMYSGWGKSLLARVKLQTFIAVDTPFLGLPSYNAILSFKDRLLSDFGDTSQILSQSCSTSQGILLLGMFARRATISSTEEVQSCHFVPPDDFYINLQYLREYGLRLLFNTPAKAVPFSVMMLPESTLRKQRHNNDISPSSTDNSNPLDADEFLPEEYSNNLKNNKKEYDQTSVSEPICGASHYAGLTEAHILRKRGDINSQNVTIKNCVGGSIHILDTSELFTITRCRDTQIVVGPVAKSLLIDGCENCEIFVVTAGVIIKNSEQLNLSLYTLTDPIIENSFKINLSPFNVAIPHLHSLWSDAGFPPNRENRFHCPSDLSESDKTLPIPHYSLQKGNITAHRICYDELVGELPSFVAFQISDFQDNFNFHCKRVAVQPETQHHYNRDRVFSNLKEIHPIDWRPSPQLIEKYYKPDNELLFDKPFQSPLRNRASISNMSGMQSNRWINNVVGSSIYRRYGDLNGGICGITNCEASLLLLIDCQSTTSITDCRTCTIVIAATDTCVVSDCSDCSLFVCSGSIRLSKCKNVNLFSWTPRAIVVENCTEINLSPWSLSVPNLTTVISLSGLDLSLPSKWYEHRPVTSDCLIQKAATVVTEVCIQGQPNPCIPDTMINFLSLSFQNQPAAVNESLLTLNSMHWDKRIIEHDSLDFIKLLKSSN